MQNQLESARHRFRRDGFTFAPPLVEPALVAQAARRMDAVIAGEYATGIPPYSRMRTGDDPSGLLKIDQVQLCDEVLREVCAHPMIGKWAAALTGAKRIRLWATQMLYKPPGGALIGSVGYHQDRQYWGYWTPESEVFTAWVALSDVTASSGPMTFASGSHSWGFLNAGNYFDPRKADFSSLPGVPRDAAVEEVAAILAPGAVSFHHRLTFHGSAPNRSTVPRRALALHLRTERSTVETGACDYYVSHLDDPAYCPILYDESVDAPLEAVSGSISP